VRKKAGAYSADLQFSPLTSKHDPVATMTPPKSIRNYMAALGKIGGSRPKNYTPEEIERRKQRLALARKSKQSKP
jgi:hypothetical protein